MTKVQTIRKIYQLLFKSFNWDTKLVNKFLDTPNFNLGDVRPITLLETGREEKLLEFVKGQLEEK